MSYTCILVSANAMSVQGIIKSACFYNSDFSENSIYFSESFSERVGRRGGVGGVGTSCLSSQMINCGLSPSVRCK